MNYCVRWECRGRVGEVFARDYCDAVTVYETMQKAGFTVEVWQGPHMCRGATVILG